jgi:hypothetical protein
MIKPQYFLLAVTERAIEKYKIAKYFWIGYAKIEDVQLHSRFPARITL